MEIDYDFVANFFETYSHESDIIGRIEAEILSTKKELAELDRLKNSADSKAKDLEKICDEIGLEKSEESDSEIGEILTLAKCVRLEQVVQG